MIMNDTLQTKPLEIKYLCSKCKKEVNPENLFCPTCQIQYKIGVSP